MRVLLSQHMQETAGLSQASILIHISTELFAVAHMCKYAVFLLCYRYTNYEMYLGCVYNPLQLENVECNDRRSCCCSPGSLPDTALLIQGQS